jgi:hypothetical protein
MRRNPFIYRAPKTKELRVVGDKVIHNLIRLYGKHLNMRERKWVEDTMKLQFVTIKNNDDLMSTVEFFVQSARRPVTVGVGNIKEMKYLYEFLRDEKIKSNVMNQGDIAIVNVNRADVREYLNVIPGGPRPIGEDVALLMTSSEGETDKMLAMAQALVGVGIPVFILAWKPGQMAMVTAKQEVHRAKDILKQSAQFAKALGLPGQPTTFRYNPLSSPDMSALIEEMQKILESAMSQAQQGRGEEATALSWRLSQLATTAQSYMDPEMPQEWQDRYRQKTMYYMRMASGLREKTGMRYRKNPTNGNRPPYEPFSPSGGAGEPTVVSGEKQTRMYRLLSMKHALKLETKGMKMSRGISVFSMVKREFGFRGSKERVYDQFVKMVDDVLQGKIPMPGWQEVPNAWKGGHDIPPETHAHPSEPMHDNRSFSNNPWLVAGPQVGFTDTPPGGQQAIPHKATPVGISQEGGPTNLPSIEMDARGTPPPKLTKSGRERVPVSQEERARRSRFALRQRKDPRTGKFYDNPQTEEYRPNPHEAPSEFTKISDSRKGDLSYSTYVKYDPEWQVFTVRHVEEKDGERTGLEVDVAAYQSEALRMWRFVKKNGFTVFLKALKKANRTIRAKRAYKESAAPVEVVHMPKAEIRTAAHHQREEDDVVRFAIQTADQVAHEVEERDFNQAVSNLMRLREMMVRAQERKYVGSWQAIQSQWERARSLVEGAWPGRIKAIR